MQVHLAMLFGRPIFILFLQRFRSHFPVSTSVLQIPTNHGQGSGLYGRTGARSQVLSASNLTFLFYAKASDDRVRDHAVQPCCQQALPRYSCFWNRRFEVVKPEPHVNDPTRCYLVFCFVSPYRLFIALVLTFSYKGHHVRLLTVHPSPCSR